jgi:hypothetical protein
LRSTLVDIRKTFIGGREATFDADQLQEEISRIQLKLKE